MVRSFPHTIAAAALILAACAPAPQAQRRAPAAAVVVPVLPEALPQRAAQTPHSNTGLAQDFLELSFQMESGRAVPELTRFEGPITVALTGNAPPSVAPDLDRLIARLRSEAGIDISRTAGPDAAITVEFIPRAALQNVVPQAACFVVPNVQSWAEFRRARNSSRVDWTALTTRTRAAVFIPNDTSPQEMRDCLHEEVAQALGPLNDLYRLTDSIFNDDNFTTVLTPFDMLILRATYAPELRSGMTRQQVADALPQVLARIHPAGSGQGGQAAGPTPRAWIDAIECALGQNRTSSNRHDAARRAVAIAQAQGWADARLAFSLFVLGRLSIADAGDTSMRAFTEAGRIYRALPGTAAQSAHVDLQMAAFALSSGQPDQALTLANRSLLAMAGAENAALMASLMLIKSEALEGLGRPSEARAVRLDLGRYARYGFGPETEIRARQSEIAALASRRG